MPRHIIQTELDTPNNPPALDANGNLAATVTLRQGDAATLNAIVLADGEIAIEVNGSGAFVAFRKGDGVTAGGETLSFGGGSSGPSYFFEAQTFQSIPDDTFTLLTSGEINETHLPGTGTYEFFLYVSIGEAGGVSGQKLRVVGNVLFLDGHASWNTSGSSFIFTDATAVAMSHIREIASGSNTFELPSIGQARVGFWALRGVFSLASGASLRIEAAQHVLDASALHVIKSHFSFRKMS